MVMTTVGRIIIYLCCTGQCLKHVMTAEGNKFFLSLFIRGVWRLEDLSRYAVVQITAFNENFCSMWHFWFTERTKFSKD